MGIRLADTLEPMADFPSAYAKDIAFDDGDTLQEKLDTGSLGGGGGGYKQLSQAEYDALTEDEKMDGREYRTYDTGHIYKLGIDYGKDGVQISDNETVEDKTWSSKKTSDEIAKVETELNAKLGDKADKTELNKCREIRVDEIYDSNSYYRVDAIGYYARPLYFRVVSTNGGEEILSFGQSVTSERKVIGKSVKATFKYIPPTSNASNGTLFIKANAVDISLTIFYTQIYSVASIPTLRDSTAEEYATGTDFNVQELATMNKVNASLGELCNKKIYCGEVTGTIVNGVISIINPIGKAGNTIATMRYTNGKAFGYSVTTQTTLSSLNFYFRWHRESDGAEAYPPDGTEITLSYMIFY